MKCVGRNILSLARRELLRVGGVSLVGGYVNAFRPFNVRPEQKVKPMTTARQVLFINIDGGMSQVNTLDAKEGPWTPSYFDIRSFQNDLKLPHGIMPNLPGVLDKIAVVRSMAAWDVVHGRAQYYIQTGHPLNLALAKEVSAIGAVIGKTDEHGGKIIDYGWSANRPIYMGDIACTIYSALGIDWTKTIENTPSGRAFHYVEPASGTKYVDFKPARELFA